jgi:hypothetical protein
VDSASGGDLALYVYGITQPGAIPEGIEQEGIDGVAGVEAQVCAGLVCWISRVSRAGFAETLPGNMENLDWLATAGVRHQKVVSELAGQATVLPARFGTVFLSEASLAADVLRRKPALLEAFQRLAGADEWGIKVFALPQSATDAATRPRPKSGSDYLRQKAQALEQEIARRGQPRNLPEEVKHFRSELERIALDSTEGGKVSSGQPHLEWQASILLSRGKISALEALIGRYSRQWQGARRIECTGPWPAYSFVKG